MILACGASRPRRPGSAADHAATVGIYQAIDILVAENCGEPGFRPPVPLGPTCVVIGAGNVGFDVVCRRFPAESLPRRGAKRRQVRQSHVGVEHHHTLATVCPEFSGSWHLDQRNVLVDRCPTSSPPASALFACGRNRRRHQIRQAR